MKCRCKRRAGFSVGCQDNDPCTLLSTALRVPLEVHGTNSCWGSGHEPEWYGQNEKTGLPHEGCNHRLHWSTAADKKSRGC